MLLRSCSVNNMDRQYNFQALPNNATSKYKLISQGDPWNRMCSWQELTMHPSITVHATTVLAILHFFYIQYFFYQICVPSEIWRHFCIYTPFFHTSKFELFDLRNPHIQIWQIPSLRIIPNPKGTKRAQKILNQSSSWQWNCCTHTFGRCCL